MSKMEVEENQVVREEEEEEEEDEEDEEEEEETLVLVELHGVIDSEIFAQDSFSKFKVLAVDSERPILQMENFIFSGEYQHTLGTAVFFEEEEKRMKCDPVFCKKPPRMLRYTCSTNKKLSMKRVFISEKSGCKDVKREGMTVMEQPPQDSSDSEHPAESPAEPDMDVSGDGDTLEPPSSHSEELMQE